MTSISSEVTRNHAIKIYNEACKKQSGLKANFTIQNMSKINNMSNSVLHQGDRIVTSNVRSFPKVLQNAHAVLTNAEKISHASVAGKVDPVTTMIALNDAQTTTTELAAFTKKLTDGFNTIFQMQL